MKQRTLTAPVLALALVGCTAAQDLGNRAPPDDAAAPAADGSSTSVAPADSGGAADAGDGTRADGPAAEACARYTSECVDEQRVRVCNASGTFDPPVPCAGLPQCLAHGCVCKDRVCQPRCTDQCERDTCSSTGKSLIPCVVASADGCRAPGPAQPCPGNCQTRALDGGLESRCVECLLDEDCPTPSRQKCASLACTARSQWAEMTLTLEDGRQAPLRSCYYCDATFTAASSSGFVRFQQGGGYYVWTLNLVPDGRGGYRADAQSPTLAISDRSPYAGYYTPQQASVVLTTQDVRPGGVVAGTLSATLVGNGHTVTLSGTFYATFP